ncbi:hypothetical protein [Deinococcus soli (ex Cha et al. 2016)]|uniref:Uncharacterized protein n=2 Tax=Deinococcus soli (ex Cha et al. 2016) TaxID=1309411 RepID=A0AAE3XCL7_9DEIO|nr:hypothetical protein [Deinococcus soli (ex Cha et al. 2016)]MDR6218423.1 hypothetical protein [Deinococcus soli (ex Cha et al. 2016)]MDR6329163.1 hypothetical protein [Deinococcus soli (ex Cha et al. 2016)]MDR6751436.1 hypothetical protein [Deinococcus soli (ex Cha et al. 2016)]
MEQKLAFENPFLQALYEFFNHIFWLFFDGQGRVFLWIASAILLVVVIAVRLTLEVRAERRARRNKR